MEFLNEFENFEKLSAHLPELESSFELAPTSPTFPGSIWPHSSKRQPAEEENFDYKERITSELNRLDANNLDPIVKKKLIQKIRNRISASRSRQRQKSSFMKIEEENRILKSELRKTVLRCAALEEENRSLR